MPNNHLGPYELNQIVTGDARILSEAILDESVDLIFTDPIYQNIDDYRWLAETAARVLKPDRACLVWYGIGYLDLTIEALKQGGLSYRWQDIMYYKNREKPSHCDMGYSKYAGLLWFEKGRMKARRSVDLIGVNVFSGSYADVLWDWGKPIDPFLQWLEAFTQPGDIVVDFFCGGGTVPAVAKMLGINYWACEIDPATAERARERVAMTQPPLFVVQPEQAVMFEAA